jgi:hypothetical protein
MYSANTEDKIGTHPIIISDIYRRQETYDSVSGDVLYNIVIEFVILMKLVSLTKLV